VTKLAGSAIIALRGPQFLEGGRAQFLGASFLFPGIRVFRIVIRTERCSYCGNIQATNTKVFPAHILTDSADKRPSQCF